jgi:hypothetical protein
VDQQISFNNMVVAELHKMAEHLAILMGHHKIERLETLVLDLQLRMAQAGEGAAVKNRARR